METWRVMGGKRCRSSSTGSYLTLASQHHTTAGTTGDLDVPSIAIHRELFAPSPLVGPTCEIFRPTGIEKCWDPVQFEISSVETCGNRNLHRN